MALPRFSYLIPQSLKEACVMLAEHEDLPRRAGTLESDASNRVAGTAGKARILAGGTDLLIKMKHGTVKPEYIIGISNIPNTDYIQFNVSRASCPRFRGQDARDTFNHNQLVIGANARLSAVAQDVQVQLYFPALAYAASVTATVQIRNMGTVVGNICNASPSADTATPLLVYDTKVVIMHPAGERTLALDEFFRGPGVTALESGEIVKELILPLTPEKCGSNYQKVSARSKVDIAAVGVSACLHVDEKETITHARIAIGSVAPVPKRVLHAEKILEGKVLTEELINQAAEISLNEAAPITDTRATAQYRKEMVDVLVRRALNKSMEQIRAKLK